MAEMLNTVKICIIQTRKDCFESFHICALLFGRREMQRQSECPDPTALQFAMGLHTDLWHFYIDS